MLSWLVQGFERMVPQPEMLKKLEVSAARPGETGELPGRGDSRVGSLSLSSCMPWVGPWRGKPHGKFSRMRETSGRHPSAPQPGCVQGGPSIWDPLVPAKPGSGFSGPCQYNGAETAAELCGAVHLGPFGVVDVPTQGRVGHRQCFATSIRPSVPLQPEPKEQKCEAVAGGEQSPFPGWPFQRGHSDFENLGAGRHQHWGCPPSLCPGVPTVPRGVGTPGSGITALPLHHMCSQTTHVLVSGWIPGGEATREVPQACPSVGGNSSLLAPLPQQFIR